MDNFKTMYLILSALEKAMDTGLDKHDVSAERLGVSESRRNAILKMLADEGYIKGVKFLSYSGGIEQVAIDGIQITIKGLEFLENNTMMKKAYRVLKGIKDILPM